MKYRWIIALLAVAALCSSCKENAPQVSNAVETTVVTETTTVPTISDLRAWENYDPAAYSGLDPELTFALNLDTAKGKSSIGETVSIWADNSLDCFRDSAENMQIKDIFQTGAYIFANIKYDCVYDVLVYDKDTKQASWLSGAEDFQTYHADKIQTLKQYCANANAETAAFPYIENRVLSISPDEKCVLLEKTAGDGVESLAVEYYICRLDTMEMTYLFDGFTTECRISGMEDAFVWIDADALRIASWTDRYDDLYRKESVRKAEVFEIDLSGDRVTVQESNVQYDYSEKIWIEANE